MSNEKQYINVQFVDLDADDFSVRTFKCETVNMSLMDMKYDIICDGCVYELNLLKYALKSVMPFDSWCRYYGWLMKYHPDHTEMFTPLNDDDFDKISSIPDRLKEETL
ncbi:MAG: hypothetical protein J6U51_01535 [Bacteroidales bacterium]|nr:hypothetical protein [Bacteroidales bacterium]